MALIFVKIALSAGLATLSLGVFPDRLRGGVLAIATSSPLLLCFISWPREK
jgi:hypothetical protein